MSRRNPAGSSILRLAGVGLLALSAAAGGRAETCALKDDDRRWAEHTLELWRQVSRDSLRLDPAPLPWIVLFDENCVWHINPDPAIAATNTADDSHETRLSVARQFLGVSGFPHGGEVKLPNDETIAARPPAPLVSFTSTYKSGEKPFFVFSMPAVWRRAPRLKTEAHLEVLIRSVFVHEMTHTRHRNFFGRLDRIEKQHKFAERFGDDIIQERFSKREDFRKAYETERDLLYQAASATDRGRKRALARLALDGMRKRHKQFFSGSDAHYAEVESIFLTMEGVASWAAYKAAVREGLSHAEAMKLIRRGGRYWAQDEGLALFLVIDSLLPNWQEKTFAEPAIPVTDLLNEAVSRE